jgi:hypothetical protein
MKGRRVYGLTEEICFGGDSRESLCTEIVRLAGDDESVAGVTNWVLG